MQFIVDKDNGIIPQVLSAILNECVNGVSLADPDLEDTPIVYVNQAFERLTGYAAHEVIGRNCRFLQGHDREQLERYKIAEALRKQQGVEVTLRNYRKDGTLFFNRLKIIPLFDKKQRVMYYLGIQYDITEKVNAQNELDNLTTLLNGLSGK